MIKKSLLIFISEDCKDKLKEKYKNIQDKHKFPFGEMIGKEIEIYIDKKTGEK